MKKKASSKKARSPDSLEGYDWSKAQRGRHAGKLRMGTPMRRLEDDLAEAFPNSASVNAALRAIVSLGKVIPRSTPAMKKKRHRAA